MPNTIIVSIVVCFINYSMWPANSQQTSGEQSADNSFNYSESPTALGRLGLRVTESATPVGEAGDEAHIGGRNRSSTLERSVSTNSGRSAEALFARGVRGGRML